MNSDFILSHAGRLARRVRELTPAGSTSDQLARRGSDAPGSSFTSGRSRPKRRAWVNEYAFAGSSRRQVRDRELAVLTNLCQQLLISNEFLYVD